jgi:Mrp family chromosome partitioning ATPase/uncharacterized protein involved in exopolysaccharide biosynthesis
MRFGGGEDEMREHLKTHELAFSEIHGVPVAASPVIVPTTTAELTYVAMLKRRWRLGLLLSGALFILSILFILKMPKTYLADVLVVLQQPARISSVGGGGTGAQPEMKQKLETLREQVLSRRTLIEVATKLNLNENTPLDDNFLELMRSNITLKLDKSAFRLAYEHRDSQTAANVANELATRYIDENLKLSKKTLSDTSQFIVSQMKILDIQVKGMEQVLQDFRKQNIGAMPEDVPANQAMLMALSTQVTQAEASLEGDKSRKQQIESRLAESLATELAQRQRTIRKLTRALNQFPQLGEDGARDIQKQVNEILSHLPTKWGGGAATRTDNPSGENRSRGAAAEAGGAEASVEADEPEVQLLKEQLRIKEIAIRDAEQNMKSLDQLRSKGMLSDAAYGKGTNDLDRARVELRMQRAQGALTRNDYLERLNVAVGEYSGLMDFQGVWVEALAKIQDLESQQFRTADDSGEVAREATRQTETALHSLEKLRQAQDAAGASPRGDMSVQVQEHSNITSALFKRRAEIRQIKLRMEELDRRLSNSSKVQVELPELMRRYKMLTDQYDNMMKFKMESDLTMGVEDQQEGGRMLIWDAAVAPSTPYKPKYATLLAIALLCSLIVGAGIVLLFGSYESLVMTSKFLTAEDVHARTSVDVLASIHDASPQAIVGPRREQGVGKPSAPNLFTTDARVNREILDCCSMMFRSQKRCPQVIAVCSAINGDGKTFVASNLAVALAGAANEELILIDANLKNPGIHSAFELPLADGLAEALEGSISRPIFHTLLAQPRLKIMTAGCVRGHSALMMSGNGLRDLLAAIRRKYDNSRIIIDIPAFADGPDAELLMDSIEGVLMVVRRGHTPIQDVMQCMKRIPRNKLMGIIFNASKTC